MTWEHHRIIFRLKSPLHVGYRKVGNLMQTRHYVHGKILWAALTARLTRDHGDGSDGRAYVKIGAAVKKHFRFGYLWPAIQCGDKVKNCDDVKNWDDVKTLFSSNWKGADLKCLEKLFPHPKVLENDEPTFDYRFLDSYASTASHPHSRGALEGSLHDTEFIAPRTRDGQQVYLAGSLWVMAGGGCQRNWKGGKTNLTTSGLAEKGVMGGDVYNRYTAHSKETTPSILQGFHGPVQYLRTSRRGAQNK
ncbi:MAG: hypothetical protein U9N43_04790 [Euryarchaeota archaeon]|nr:hypothetical protein [Euryarchaeota archaeon]